MPPACNKRVVLCIYRVLIEIYGNFKLELDLMLNLVVFLV